MTETLHLPEPHEPPEEPPEDESGICQNHMRHIYEWKFRSMGISAQAAGEFLETLSQQHNGRLTPQIIVDAARDENSLIHPCFQWNDSIAAEEHRKQQARQLMGNLIVVHDTGNRQIRTRSRVNIEITREPEEPTTAETPACVPPRRERFYLSVQDVMHDPESRDYLLDQARREIASYRRKYATLNELSLLFSAIDAFLDEAAEV